LIAANAFGASSARVAISRDTVGSEATAPKTPDSSRNSARSARQSPPTATDTARSSRIFPGSCVANGLRDSADTAGMPLTPVDCDAATAGSPFEAVEHDGVGDCGAVSETEYSSYPYGRTDMRRWV